MSHCIVCNKYSQKSPLTNFFRFPKDPTRCEKWAEKCQLSEELNRFGANYFYKSFRICSDHFNSSNIYWDGKKKRLLSNAVPEIFKWNSTPRTRTVSCQPKGLDTQTALEVDKMLSCDDSEFLLQMVEHLCRLCGEERHGLTYIFGPRGQSICLPKKLEYIPLIKVYENDVMPTRICAGCIKRVEENYNFVTKCLQADEKLRIMLDMEGVRTDFDSCSPSSPNKNILSQDQPHDFPNVETAPPPFRSLNFSGSSSLRHDYSLMLMKNASFPDRAKKIKQKRSRKKFHCSECNRSFATLLILEAHSKAHALVMNGSGQFECDECGVTFHNRYSLCSHQRRHSGEKPYICSKCKASFYDFSLLQQHFRTHLPKQFTCDICHKSFLRKSKLIHHILRKICLRRGPGIGVDETDTLLMKSFKCQACHKLYGSLTSLNRHWRSHRNRNKYLCAECGKWFTRLDSLNNHTRIHTGERPFSCSICGFSFKQKGDCKKHEANHQKL